jgi:hypothetical protein
MNLIGILKPIVVYFGGMGGWENGVGMVVYVE